MIRFIAMIVFLASTSSSSEGRATMISLDSSYGAGTITRDLSTGLDWLDLSVTRGLSWSFVEARTGVGDIYEGFRLATREEVFGLASDAGAQDPIYPPSPSNAVPIQELTDLLGQTFVDSGGSIFACGVMNVSSGQSSGVLGRARIPLCLHVSVLGGTIVDLSTQSEFEANPASSTWLVRPSTGTVPTPSTLLLTLLGGLVLVAHGRFGARTPRC